jgi:hypothetical protein
MRGSLFVILLAPIYAIAGVIGSCGPGGGFCSFSATETAVGNLLTIDFNAVAEHAGGATLNEVVLLDLSGLPPGSTMGELGIADLTFFAGADGFTQSMGAFGGPGIAFPDIACAATSMNPNPDAPPVVNHCYNGGPTFFHLQSAIPINMQISAGSGSGEVYFQAAFFALDPVGSQIRPVGVSLMPEPIPIWLCGAGLLAVCIYRKWNFRPVG